MKRSFTKTLIIQLSLTIGLVALFLMSAFFVRSRITENEKDIRRLKQEAEFNTAAIQSLTALKQAALEAVTYKGYFDVILPKADVLITLPNDLRALAREYNLTLGFNFGTEKPSDSSHAGEIAFQMNVGGDAQNIISFLHEIRRLPIIIAIDNVDFTQDIHNYNARMSGKVFSR
jgi:Tfp pilus assembly protein PilO